MYDTFLAILTQLSGQKKARVVVQGSVIFIETSGKKNCWSLSTRIFNREGFIPPSVRECISSNGMMKWQDRAAYLHLDPIDQSVYLIHEINSSPKYVPFKYLVTDFIAVANEWKEILEDFAGRDHISLRLENDYN